jgi:ribosome-binding factor A
MSRNRGERVRPERLAEQIRMDVAEILQSQLKDPRLPLVTCTRVAVTNDLKSAKLYVSVLGDEAQRKRAMKVLEVRRATCGASAQSSASARHRKSGSCSTRRSSTDPARGASPVGEGAVPAPEDVEAEPEPESE